MPTDNKIPDSKPRRQGFEPIGVAAVQAQGTLRERMLRAVLEDRSPTEMPDEFEDPAMDVIPLPIEMLLQNRWDAAAGVAWNGTKGLMSGDAALCNQIELLLLGSGPVDKSVERSVWGVLVGDVAERLEARGLIQIAIAWRMLRADPQKPWTFARFMPQLDHLLDLAGRTSDDKVLRQAMHRIRVWRQALNGEFTSFSTSIFHITEVELDRDILQIEDELHAEREPAQKKPNIWDKIEEQKQKASLPPGIVAIPKKTSTKLVDRDGHTGFGDLIGKHLRHVLAPDLKVVRSTLLAEYPHAAAVVDMLLRDLRESRPAVIKPILIVGEPGGGKSRVVRLLGELLGMHVHRFDASGSTDNFFAGMSKGWSGTQPSVPVRGLGLARSATFIVMVDELEKAGTRTHAGNLWQALGPFLEKETSRRFRDPSLDCEVDLSWVSHIATANETEPLPAFLLDRYRVVRWPMPTLEHLPQLAANVLQEIEREVGEIGFNAPLEEDELDVIGRVWKRERFSIRKLQKLVSATLDARAATAMRH